MTSRTTAPRQGLGAALPPAAVDVNTPVLDTPKRAATPASTGLLRDSAVIATGVLGGSLLFHGLASAFEGSSEPAAGGAEGADLDFGSELWA